MLFEFCPSCRSARPDFIDGKEIRCRVCGFRYFHNVAAAAGLLLLVNGRLLMITRGREPGAGKLDLPGGFVDPGESAEEALKRELMEEMGFVPPSFSFFHSYGNTYQFAGIWYNTCDIFFLATMSEVQFSPDQAEVAAVSWIEPELFSDSKFIEEQVAFPSVRKTLADLSHRL